jgi:hypothetical protein
MSKIITSTYYFVATAYGKEMIREIPVFALTSGENFENNWLSNDVNSREGFRGITDAASGSRLVTIAIPKNIEAIHFGIKKHYEKLVIDAFNLSKEGQYMMGASVTMIFQAVTVIKSKGIIEWRGLPAPHEGQRNRLDRTMPRWWAPMAVTLFVTNGEANTL